MNYEVLTVTTDADGNGSATSTNSRTGFLYGIQYVKTDYADGVDFTLASASSLAAATLLTITNCNASVSYYPRVDSSGVTGTALTANNTMIPFSGHLKVTVAQGGATKTGKFIVWWFD